MNREGAKDAKGIKYNIRELKAALNPSSFLKTSRISLAFLALFAPSR
jgi:hypothetical protein